MAHISDYEKIVGKDIIDELRLISKRLKGRKIQCISSTPRGDAVSEMLSRLIPLLNDLGVDVGWDIITRDADYTSVTKAFYKALDGKSGNITQNMFDKFLQTGESIIKNTKLYGDIIFIHDLEPLMLIEKREKTTRWIWRSYFDLSHPYMEVWEFFRRFIEEYNVAVFSSPKFTRKLAIPKILVAPSIDPFSEKNRELTQSEIDKVLYKYGINKTKPVITQISRFDYSKDPIGVIGAYRLTKKYINCQLILAGNRPPLGDPETNTVYNEVMEYKGDDPDIHVLSIEPATNDFDINALQRASDVIVQKSMEEGFALAVTEALWKEKAVIVSSVGGIPEEITHKYSGLLCYTVGGAAIYIRELLNNPSYARELGKNGKEHVRRNFLSTRHLRDLILLFLYLYHPEDIIYL